jgi:serine/threonine protein kinase/tetratricopeptide (TPR) repeat protein
VRDLSSSDRFRRLEALFHQLDALEPSARAARLERIRAEDVLLHSEVTALLEPSPQTTHDEEQLDRMSSAGGLAASLGRRGMPESIGPYRILGLLGEGGMGQVFEAEQQEPVRRRVALKLATGVWLSDAARARFQAERQALAVLDHPNIAKVFDTGDTDDGQPWFAMELVDGVSITCWAVAHDLSVRQRIELMLPVCDAVQHAHQKGLIHRDLKPANLLVSDNGGLGHPRVIDFGVAKTMTRPDDDPDFATRAGDVLGTPEYMSPEQATLGEVDIDTRTDVYALGQVLYELLTGRLPIDADTLRGASFGELCRYIREQPVIAPSQLPAVDGPMSASAWRQQLRGDLDRVVLKALAKDRDQRYASVTAFADDLRRFLDDQPVLAMPPRVGYRLRKFVRRNRVLVVAAGLVVVALLGATVLASLGLMEARESERRALASAATAERERLAAEATTEFVVNLFRAANPMNESGPEVTAGDLLRQGEERIDDLSGQPGIQAELLAALGGAYYGLDEAERAETMLRRALALRSEGVAADLHKRAAVGSRLADLLRESSQHSEAEQLYRMGLTTLAELGKLDSADEIVLLTGLGVTLIRTAKLDEAEQVFRRALSLVELLPEEPSGDDQVRRSHRINTLGNLVGLYAAQGRNAEAAAMTRDLIAQLQSVLPEGHPNIAVLYTNLSVLLANDGELGSALDHALRSVDLGRDSLGLDHPRTATHLFHLGTLQWRLGRFEAAAASLEEAISIYGRVYGKKHHDLIRPLLRLAQVRMQQANLTLALDLAKQAAAVLEVQDQGALAFDASLTWIDLARLRLDTGDPAAALRLAARAAEGTGPAVDVTRARVLLFRALLDAHAGHIGKARAELTEAEALAGCTGSGCVLDQPVDGTIRAEVLARLGDLEAAALRIDDAVAGPGWTSWMLQLNDLTPLRERPEWSRIEAGLERRL